MITGIRSRAGDIVNMLFIIVILSVISTVSSIVYAKPTIVSWSSTGGHTKNKDGPQDRMYLVKEGDKITFTVKAEGAAKYIWQVNKRVQNEATSNTFVFAVPNSKGIWEIHVEAIGKGGSAHAEWVVSTLSKAEAPDFFEYFTDGRIKDRTETDPWGRKLPNWKGDAPDLRTFSAQTDPHVRITTPCKITEGTWVFWYKFTYPTSAGHGGNIHVTFYPIYSFRGTKYDWSKVWDAHHHCCIAHPSIISMPFSMDYDGASVYEDGKWHKIILIRQNGYFYAFKEMIHPALPNGRMVMFEFHAYDPIAGDPNTNLIKIYMREYGSVNPVHLDCIQVYKGKYLFPPKQIYVGNYYYKSTKDRGRTAPLWKKGIIVQGRNVSLQDIDKAINNPSIFRYDSESKTAICYMDLVVDEAAELVIKNETLKFHCKSDGENAFVLDAGSRLYVENSTITSDTSHWWVWNLASSTTHWGNEKCMYWPGKKIPSYGPSNWSGYIPLDVAYHGEFVVKNSTVNNFAHLFFDSPYEVHITNSKFTNIHEVDIANYPKGVLRSRGQASRPFRFCKGKKAVWIYTDSININDFVLRNVVFSGATHPINLVFSLNAHRDKYNVYDIDAKDDYIVIKESMAEVGNQSHSAYVSGSKGPWGKIYADDSYIASELGLVNCRFKDVLITEGVFKDADGRAKQKAAYVKYYLDVKVVDKSGKPIKDAIVKVKVEQDWTLDDMKTNHYPVENMVVKKPYATGNYRCFYHHYRWTDGQPISKTYTTPSGHTPLPSEDPANTLIITDFKKYYDLSTEQIKKKEFTYTIIVEKNGLRKIIKGINPSPEWYRPDRNKPTYTITAVLDGKTTTEEELKKQGLAGKIKL